MEQFISIIIFSLPGLLAYFWLQLFGLNPTVKHTPTEMIGLSALLWVPITGLTIISYNVFVYIFNIPVMNITSVEDIRILSNQLLFLMFFVFLSTIFSFLIAYVWGRSLYKLVLNLVNKVRVQRKTSMLSEDTSVWDSFFFTLEQEEEQPMIVEMYKIDKKEEKIYGAVIRMSRPFETERSLVLDQSKQWEESHKYYQYPVKRSYVDVKSGMVVNELDYLNPTKNTNHEVEEPQV
ncbi:MULTISPECIES: hypothetical protein [Bacillus]|uniref:hypothetical protein n=1 Tax=Bacillus TaxID=1386 RepID=UPI000C6E23E3|nr:MULTISPECIES: hypothetical protein [Bacillus]KAB2419288.1 hypothetical protein F8167_29375 [Bacillus cereus]MDF9627295.1 hypothetical protein [Bacillus cereus]PKS14874.1 hypothetical protein CX118_22520 [Bacillus sp. BI3]